MVAAGETAQAGKTPSERIATNIVTADSAAFTTTETQVQSVTAALVTGRVYRVRWATHFSSSVATDLIVARIREDNATGTELQSGQVPLTNFTSAVGAPLDIEVEFTAISTGNKTFSGAGIRASGTGNCVLEAAANRPSYMYVEYVRGP